MFSHLVLLSIGKLENQLIVLYFLILSLRLQGTQLLRASLLIVLEVYEDILLIYQV